MSQDVVRHRGGHGHDVRLRIVPDGEEVREAVLRQGHRQLLQRYPPSSQRAASMSFGCRSPGSFPGTTQTMPLAVYNALQTDPDAGSYFFIRWSLVMCSSVSGITP